MSYVVGADYTIGTPTQQRTGLGKIVTIIGFTGDDHRVVVADKQDPTRTAEVKFSNIGYLVAPDGTYVDMITGKIVENRSRRQLALSVKASPANASVTEPHTERMMTARDKYINVFGRLKSLAEQIPWSTGVSNMLEWLTWNTSNVLGVTKTQYWEQIIAWTDEDAIRDGMREEKVK